MVVVGVQAIAPEGFQRRMEFRILGPLEAEHEGSQIPLRGAKMRSLLATLLLRANHVVSADYLVDVLWGGDSERGSTAALQVCISNLRKLIEPHREARSSPER